MSIDAAREARVALCILDQHWLAMLQRPAGDALPRLQAHWDLDRASPDQRPHKTKLTRLEVGLEQTGAANYVMAVLLDFRAYDTLGEATVLFCAILGALADTGSVVEPQSAPLWLLLWDF